MGKSDIIARCHTCHFPIYQGDLIHQSSTGTHSGTIDTMGVDQDIGDGTTIRGSHGTYRGSSDSEQWIQCQWCIDEWNKEIDRKNEYLKKWKTLWWSVLLGLPTIGTILYKLEIGIKPLPRTKPASIFGALFIGLLLTSFVVCPLLWWVVKYFAPNVDRYRFRERPTETIEFKYPEDKQNEEIDQKAETPSSFFTCSSCQRIYKNDMKGQDNKCKNC